MATFEYGNYVGSSNPYKGTKEMHIYCTSHREMTALRVFLTTMGCKWPSTMTPEENMEFPFVVVYSNGHIGGNLSDEAATRRGLSVYPFSGEVLCVLGRELAYLVVNDNDT